MVESQDTSIEFQNKAVKYAGEKSHAIRIIPAILQGYGREQALNGGYW